jgi:hypothetical protein
MGAKHSEPGAKKRRPVARAAAGFQFAYINDGYHEPHTASAARPQARARPISRRLLQLGQLVGVNLPSPRSGGDVGA